MWNIYDIRHDQYWNEQRHTWSTAEQATGYTVQERNRVPLPELSIQWRFVIPECLSKQPRNASLSA